MSGKAVFEVTVTGMENREWQGSVYFPASGERWPFQSLLELIEAVERGAGPGDQAQGEPRR